MVGDVLVADADLALEVVEDDGRQLLHLEALRIVAADLFQVGHDMVEIELAINPAAVLWSRSCAFLNGET